MHFHVFALKSATIHYKNSKISKHLCLKRSDQIFIDAPADPLELESRRRARPHALNIKRVRFHYLKRPNQSAGKLLVAASGD